MVVSKRIVILLGFLLPCEQDHVLVKVISLNHHGITSIQFSHLEWQRVFFAIRQCPFEVSFHVFKSFHKRATSTDLFRRQSRKVVAEPFSQKLVEISVDGSASTFST